MGAEHSLVYQTTIDHCISQILSFKCRTVSRPQDDILSLRYMGATYSRPVRHLGEQQGRGVLSRLPEAMALQGNSLQTD